MRSALLTFLVSLLFLTVVGAYGAFATVFSTEQIFYVMLLTYCSCLVISSSVLLYGTFRKKRSDDRFVKQLNEILKEAQSEAKNIGKGDQGLDITLTGDKKIH